MALKIDYPLDYYPQIAKNENASNGLKALHDASIAINEALGKVRDPRALTAAIRSKAAEAVRMAQASHKYTAAAAESKSKLIREQLQKRSEWEKETREHIRASKNPADTVRQFIVSGDVEAAAAAFRAPPYLTGLTGRRHGNALHLRQVAVHARAISAGKGS